MDQQIKAAILLFCQTGAGINDIHQSCAPETARRTLQRWLKLLVAQGDLQQQGRGRAIQYYTTKTEVSSDIIPLSQQAEAIQQYVKMPIANRKPVSYQASFLESYSPNQTFYLSDSVRQHLTNLARQPEVKPIAATFVKRILNRLIIDLSWNSSRLEGNTYSILETQRLLELGESADNKTIEEKQMILNHKAAISFLVELNERLIVSKEVIFNLHALLANNLLKNPMAIGRLRVTAVGVSKTVYYPLEIPQSIEHYFSILIEKANLIIDPIEQAFFLMVHIPYLQGFEDVNKRVSRLAANIPFIKNNYCPLSFVDVPEEIYIDSILSVYELMDVGLLREIFVWSYERSIARYSSIKEAMGQPDVIQWQYRTLIFDTVRQIIVSQISPAEATVQIKKIITTQVKPEYQMHLQEIIETELIYLYPGNIARYQISFEEYEEWAKQWRRS